jgi:ubiquinone/menaquinone biosynthesis C-methylase UbiE
MATLRGSLQGVTNIVRFNWHFYALSAALILAAFLLNLTMGSQYTSYVAWLTALVAIPIIISLSVSFLVYDLSGLYSLTWLKDINAGKGSTIININAGFDEMSQSLHARYPEAKLIVFDFYDPQKHTEVSIERARRAYPPYPGTHLVSTADLQLADSSADLVVVILAAHEIRDEQERIMFFAELRRILTPNGQVVVTEHLRDLTNFLAYNIGFFHFLSRASWYRVFAANKLSIEKQISITPFITSFILSKDGTAS